MNNSTFAKVTCFGEVLWDLFPEHKKIGGAPLNVALRVHSLGIPVSFISRVGEDQYGEGILSFLKERQVDISTIQIDKHFATGLVKVTLDQKGSATYQITQPVAWDKIECNEKAIEAVKQSAVFVYGSLVCRDTNSKSALLSLMNYANIKVFDVNLRAPFYTYELVAELMHASDFIKCNDEELLELCDHLKINANSVKEQIVLLSKATKTNQICVTLGANGALLYTAGSFYEHPGYKIKVKDTVGAGDSFLGTLISNLLVEERPPEIALSYACALGALVASKEGANPKISTAEIEKLMAN